jgi:aspartyl-tRNA synthetase
MNRNFISECLEKIDETVLLKGWINTIRSHGKIAFIDLRDKSGTIQTVCAPENLINPNLPTGTIELELQEIQVLSKSVEMPFDMGAATGMPPEGGFSFGLERVTMKILELANVREASLFPRDMQRIDILLSNQ